VSAREKAHPDMEKDGRGEQKCENSVGAAEEGIELIGPRRTIGSPPAESIDHDLASRGTVSSNVGSRDKNLSAQELCILPLLMAILRCERP
jgi:hypothetical protein